MAFKYILCCVASLCVLGCGTQSDQAQPVVLIVNDYQVTRNEFEEGFSRSFMADRPDKIQARREYLDNLINQKLILLDAQKKGIDKNREFLRSIERFWEQSLMTVALGTKTREINKSFVVSEPEIRRFYEGMIKDGIITKSYEDVYAQIKWQAQRQMESRLLDEWMKELRSNARVNINKDLLKAE